MGRPLGRRRLILAVVFAAVSVVGVVVGVAKTAEQASNAQSVIALVLGLLGGSFFPLSQGEGWLTRLKVLTPHYWFLRGLGDATAGGLTDVLGSLAMLVAFGVVVGLAGVLMLRRGAWRAAA